MQEEEREKLARVRWARPRRPFDSGRPVYNGLSGNQLGSKQHSPGETSATRTERKGEVPLEAFPTACITGKGSGHSQ